PGAAQLARAVRLDLAELELAAGRPHAAREALTPWRAAAGSEPSSADPYGFLLLGWAALEEADWSAAEAAWQALLRTRRPAPADWLARAHAVLGWLSLRRGDVEQARAHYEVSLRQDAAESAQDAYGLMLALQRDDRAAEALQVLEAYDGEIDPALRWRWSFARAFLLFQTGRHEEVIPAVEGALQSGDPDSLQAHALTLLGDARRRLNQNREALAAYRQAASKAGDPSEDLLWRWAVTSLDLQHWGEAGRILKDILQRFPASQRRGEAAFWHGETLYRLGRYRDASAAYRRALRHGYDPAPARYGWGWCAYVRGDYAAAADQFARAEAAGLPRAQSADAALCRGHALSNLRKWEEAWTAYEKAVQLGGGTGRAEEARFRQGRLLLRRGLAADAARTWEELARDTENASLAAQAGYWAAQGWFRAGAFETAVAAFETALDHSALTDSLRAAAALGAADALYNLDRLEEAEERYRSLVTRSRAPVSLRSTAADGVYNTLVRREQWEAAATFLEEAEEAFPELARAGERHLRIADGYLQNGDAGAAAEAYRKLLQRDDLTPALRVKAHRGAARAGERLGRPGEAAEHWEAAGRHSDRERRGALWVSAARLFLDAGRPRDAVRLAEELRGRDLPLDDPWRIALILARAYEELERIEPALEAWRATARDAPSDTVRVQAWARLGHLLYQREDYTAALAAYERADSLAPLGQAYRPSYWRGEILYKLERWPEAAEQLARFLADPPEEPLWRAMARLRRAAALEKLERWEAALEEYGRVLALAVSDALLEEARIRRRQVEAWRDTSRAGESRP
ncbi:MAG: tetratricopeptide repeat protein, partial [Candidatus Eisenbacteria bacterium]|nr:tetratricopeptide repeat protein [Candidatus Eisenbacteria bacterium]